MFERSGRGFLVEEVALEDTGVAQQDLAVGIALPFGLRQGDAAAADPVMALGLDEGDAAALGQSIALRHRATDDVEEAQRLRRNRGAGAEPMPAGGEAEMALQIAEHQQIEQAKRGTVEYVGRAGLPSVGQRAAPGKARPGKALPQPAALAEPEQEALLKLFID